MAIIAGDIREYSIDHPELGSIVLDAKSTEDNEINIGGFENVDDDAGITSGGERIYQKNFIPWDASVTIGNKDGVLDTLKAMAASTVEGTHTITFMSGEVRVGKGMPVGKITANNQSGTIALKVSGSGALEKI